MPPALLRSLLRTTPTLSSLSYRGLLSITGSQASEFLNGLLAASVREPIQGPLFAAFLHAQGRVLYDVFLYTDNIDGQRGFLLEYDTRPSEAPPLLAYIKRHVLRSKVKIRDVSDQYDIWAAWGSPKDHNWETKRNWTWASSGAIEPKWDNSSQWPWGTEDHVILDRRAVGLGRRLLVRKGDRPLDASTHDIVSGDAYLLHRILHGVPEGSTEITPMQAFPMDSNLDVMGALDFRKGCYVGQELTVRTYHTGVVRKRIMPVTISQPNQPQGTWETSSVIFPPNLEIRPSLIGSINAERPVPRPRGSGKLLNSAHGVGLALLRLEHEAGFQKGDIKLELGLQGDKKQAWVVSPWFPNWWPQSQMNSTTE